MLEGPLVPPPDTAPAERSSGASGGTGTPSASALNSAERGAESTRASSAITSRVVTIGRELKTLWPAGLFSTLLLACANAIPMWMLPRTRLVLLRAAGVGITNGSRCQGRVFIVGPGGAASRLTVGAGTIIAQDVTFALDAPITIGRNVCIGPYSRLFTATHPTGTHARRMDLRVAGHEVVVEDGVWIGMSALILPGVRLGAGCIVGAGAVVTSNVPPDVLVAGIPAKVIRSLPD